MTTEWNAAQCIRDFFPDQTDVLSENMSGITIPASRAPDSLSLISMAVSGMWSYFSYTRPGT